MIIMQFHQVHVVVWLIVQKRKTIYKLAASTKVRFSKFPQKITGNKPQLTGSWPEVDRRVVDSWFDIDLSIWREINEDYEWIFARV